MTSFVVLVTLMLTAALLSMATVLRRRNRTTESADGLRIEQAHRDQAHVARYDYRPPFVDGSFSGGPPRGRR
ncbi:Hypothetical protein B591_08455 [Streptomyces sp. GBA 94-10 4N24]|uniref:hypothetical protein n=1 Tax=unclassified Streptomyces TaxID=2593676 RepID=UPI0003C2C5AC|nr:MULTISPECIES: hypothetical protein [unclassified Streptomyces]ESP99735.1 Hypothetical protein B591_08455 [Streptomyces sp. GBA 94-10 4N24]ESQ05793.1 Hypothetical protein B590_08590 [Streptomyces sp. PVA_94-07]UZN58690.1 Hypothetical protein B591N_08455 [Streptomyces sp. GBA 94-10 4N24]